MSKKIKDVFTDEEWSAILSAHEAGQLVTQPGSRGDISQRLCALDVVWGLDPKTYIGFDRDYAVGDIYRRFDDRYSVSMTPEEVVGIWDDIKKASWAK